MTHFIHNAWKVNFNHALNSFEAQISGTRKLLDLCFSSTRPIRVLFTSSVSVAHGWDVVNGPVPEESLPNPELAVSTGYASSKYVTEQVSCAAFNFTPVILMPWISSFLQRRPKTDLKPPFFVWGKFVAQRRQARGM